MQALIDETQQEFRDVANQIARSIGIENPSDLGSTTWVAGWPTLASAGLLELRERTDGAPLASGFEVALLSDALGAALAPAPYLASGALAVDLVSRSGDSAGWLPALVSGEKMYGLLLSEDLTSLAEAESQTTGILWGGGPDAFALALRRTADGGGTLARRSAAGAKDLDSVSPTNELWELGVGEWEYAGSISADDLQRFEALALTGLAADTVGALRTALEGLVAYSQHRIAYGVPIGTFQAVQHIAADAYTAIAGVNAATNYAAWAIDELDGAEALLAARTAKAAAAAIALGAAEDVMQLYGGIGQTWDHIAHFYTRRVMFDTAVWGDESVQLQAIADARLKGE